MAKRKAQEDARIKAEEEARIREEEETRKWAEKEAKIRAKEETKMRAEEEAKIRAEKEAKKRAEEEAKIKAENEAKKWAEEEAKIRAKEEAKMRAEEEAKIRAEKEAKKRASEEEARIIAENEARKRKEEEEVRIRAEEEAKKRAEEEARISAENEARKREEKEARIRAEEERKKAEKVAKIRTEEEERIGEEENESKSNENVNIENMIRNGNFENGEVTPWACKQAQCDASQQYLFVSKIAKNWAGPRQFLPTEKFRTNNDLNVLFKFSIKSSHPITSKWNIRVTLPTENTNKNYKYFSIFKQNIQNQEWIHFSEFLTLPNTILGAKEIMIYMEESQKLDYSLDNIILEKAEVNMEKEISGKNTGQRLMELNLSSTQVIIILSHRQTIFTLSRHSIYYVKEM